VEANGEARDALAAGRVSLGQLVEDSTANLWGSRDPGTVTQPLRQANLHEYAFAHEDLVVLVESRDVARLE
jgi:hypothetical protein